MPTRIMHARINAYAIPGRTYRTHAIHVRTHYAPTRIHIRPQLAHGCPYSSATRSCKPTQPTHAHNTHMGLHHTPTQHDTPAHNTHNARNVYAHLHVMGRHATALDTCGSPTKCVMAVQFPPTWTHIPRPRTTHGHPQQMRDSPHTFLGGHNAYVDMRIGCPQLATWTYVAACTHIRERPYTRTGCPRPTRLARPQSATWMPKALYVGLHAAYLDVHNATHGCPRNLHGCP